ncbi:hypothetical protein NBRC116594_24770 [Shimia sp. NS0008-38b]|uniref:lysozyme inhibitor LprI family protein n=1 Tax=Shimia sp. NS0008-38b TaxID=3127653 RepID=UPI00310B1A96
MGLRILIAVAAVPILVAVMPSFAQGIAFSPDATETCLADIDRKTDRRICVGQSARACEQGGDIAGCMSAEIAYWDARLDVVFGLVMERAIGKDGNATSLNLIPRDQAGALQTAQDSWLAYRADACAFEQTFWSSGDADSPEVRACHLYLTAEQVFYLEAIALIE